MIMRQDIDLRLVVIIVLVVGALIGITLFYNHTAGGIVNKYENLQDTYISTKNNLTKTSTLLAQCREESQNLTLELKDTLSYQKESSSEFNDLFEETAGQLEQTSSVLNETQSSLDQTRSALTKAKNDLEDAQEELVACTDDLELYSDLSDKLQAKGLTFQEELNDCANENDPSACVSELNEDFDAIYNYIQKLDDIEK